MIPLDIRKTQLETRKAQLTGRLGQITEEFGEHAEKDWAEMATEREGDEVLADLGAAAQLELRAIEAALERMAAGEYGFCVTCGEPISDERLDLLPATPFCRRHAGAGH